MAEQKKKMNLMQLTFIVAVNMMGSGIIMLPTNMAQVGAISLLSWIVTAVGSMAIAYGFAQAGIFNQRTGGMAAYAEDAYGKPGYFQVFLLYFLSLAIGNVAIAISAVGYLAGFFPWLSSTPIATCIGVIGLLWLTTVANFGGPSVTGKIGSITVWGVILPVGAALDHRLVLVQQRHVRRGLESAGTEHRGGHGLEHRAHAVGLPRHGIRGAELGRGRESEAQRAARLHVRHARRRRDLRALDDRDPGHRAERRARELDRPVRARVRADVQPDVGSIVMGLAVLACLGSLLGWQFTIASDRQVGRRGADVPGVLREGEQHGRAGHRHDRARRRADRCSRCRRSRRRSASSSARSSTWRSSRTSFRTSSRCRRCSS